MGISVRELNEKDAVAYRELLLLGLKTYPSAFLSDFESEEKQEIEATRLRFQTSMNHPYNVVLGALEDGELVGMLGLFREINRPKRHHKLTIWGMIVHPDFQRRNIARSLIEKAIAHARTLPDITRIELGVESKNTAARALYESCGFVTWGVEPEAMVISGQGHHEVMMSLRLK